MVAVLKKETTAWICNKIIAGGLKTIVAWKWYNDSTERERAENEWCDEDSRKDVDKQ